MRPALPSNIGDILSFGFWLEKKGYKPLTVRSAVSSLKAISRRVNLLDVQRVLAYLATAQVSDVRKEGLASHLYNFYSYKGIAFDKPRYKRVEKLPFIPQESEIDQLIGGVAKKCAVFLQLLKETGIRCGEGWALKWVDLDAENHAVNVTAEKGSHARRLKLSSKLLTMLNSLPHKYTFIFHTAEANPITSLDYFRRAFDRQRKTVADRLENPRIRQIGFHTLRHYRATMEYHKTKDILHVMQLLGHRNIQNTLVYTHLVNFESDEWVCKTTDKLEEAKALVESGFEYVCDVDCYKLFRKRK